MQILQEILIVLAAIANVGSFIFQLWEYKQRRRMMKGEKREAGGNQPNQFRYYRIARQKLQPSGFAGDLIVIHN